MHDIPFLSTLQQYGESTEAIQAALASHEDEYDGIKNGEDEPDDEEVEQEDESDDDDDLDIVTVAPQRSVDFRWVSGGPWVAYDVLTAYSSLLPSQKSIGCSSIRTWSNVPVWNGSYPPDAASKR